MEVVNLLINSCLGNNVNDGVNLLPEIGKTGNLNELIGREAFLQQSLPAWALGLLRAL